MNLDDLHTTKDAAWTVTAVADLLDVDERTVRRACEDGQLPCLHVGRRLLIPTEPLRALLCPNTPDMSADPATTGPSTATTHQDFGGPSNAKNTALRSA